METTPFCTIPGNPDIAGVGVRASVYAQACLAILAIAYTCVRKFREDQKSGGYGQVAAVEFFINHGRLLKRLGITLMLTGASLILSAIVEAKSHTGPGLTVYHALIVLNLSWINNAAGFSLHFFAWLTFANFTTESFSRRSWLLFRDLWAFSAHSTAMSVMGIWFWANPAAFSRHVATGQDGAPCVPQTFFWFFAPIRATNPKLRVISLIIYPMTCIPILSTAIHSFPFFLLWILAEVGIPDGLGYSLLAASFISPITFFMIMTEMLIASNHENVDRGVEDRWTYGQTLALAAALISVGFVLVEMWSLWRNWREGEKDWSSTIAKLLEVQEGRERDWIRMREVADEVEQISRRKLIRNGQSRSWSEALGMLAAVQKSRAEDWEHLRRISGQLVLTSIDNIVHGKQRED